MSNQMKEIDWREAPGCAVAALVATTDNVHYPSVEFVTGYHAYGCMIRATSAVDGRSLSAPSDCWFLVDRPVSPWTGDDLPPVGTVCEFKAGHSQFPELSWTEVRIVSHDSQGGRDFAVFASMSGYGGCCNPADFRPIRTPEQIAAEERESHINGMLCHDALGGTRRGLAEALYDAGYRKVTP
ncbi:hypothetical protein [Stutzerimonas frequens]|uniref:Uncharacterized protein n=1 Tax=Stutzerimonas frequens TaxID=2968969 RepID=A0AA47HWW8_9GAMM|nr:hypothetical protein [Stutzerimonas frequens]WAE51208.1 hypothetical protein OSV15_16190 [Stutzerimonas frequens]